MKSPTTRYYLEPARNTAHRNKPELITVEINYGYFEINKNGKRRYMPLRFSLQCKISPDKWGLKEENYKFHEPTFKKYTRNNATIRNKMNLFESNLTKVLYDFESKKIFPTPKQLRIALDEKLRTKFNFVQKITLIDVLKAKIEVDKVNSNLSKRDSISPATIKVYETILHLIENYQIATNQILFLDGFDETKYWHLWDIADQILRGEIEVINPNQPKRQRKQKYGYLISTLRKYQKSLIKVLRQAKKTYIDIPLNLDNENLVLASQEDATRDYIIDPEIIQNLINCDKELSKDLQEAKDYIIIGCCTGMRYQSMKLAESTKIEYYKDENYSFHYLHSIHKKTKSEVYIPILKPFNDIITNRSFPKIYSNATINKNLKKLFQELNFDHEVIIKKHTYKEGIIEEKAPLHKVIRTHDCKGSFYSNLYALGVSENVISQITHPDKKPENAMARVYNKTSMLNRAKMFVNEIKQINSNIYRL